MKRHLVFPQDFDTRSHFLEEEKDSWDESAKLLHKKNRESLLLSLERELGTHNFGIKVRNFKDIGPKPFSVVSFHNRFFHEVRHAYVVESYYPALVGACALGERILNHMVINLRNCFKATHEYKKVYRKKSFDDWKLAINTLSSWNVLDETLAGEFRKLWELRNKSVHFNMETYKCVQSDRLQAIQIMAEIISLRFGFFRKEHNWAIEGTRGAQFIKKEYEDDPFIKTFYLPSCPLVGPYYAVKPFQNSILFVDRKDYANEEITDEEFAEKHTNRKTSEVAASDLPLTDDVIPVGALFPDGSYQLLEKATP